VRGHARTRLKTRDEVSEYSLQIVKDVVVPIAHDNDIFLGQPARATFVCLLLLFSVLAAVEFDREAKSWAIEVECERANRMLSPEMEAVELLTAYCMPKPRLSIRHFVTELSRTSRESFRSGKA
jgi:hypothetical protein